ncbi:MAG: peptidoglycan-associated lipoprotein Pal [Deltaproteobacteria bacterium]|nr:MAG: peptidoglycan-associated lipoprotein Pal [Deltaproteobacteria bacterium]
MRRSLVSAMLLVVLLGMFGMGCPKKTPPPPPPPVTEEKPKPKVEEPVVKPKPPEKPKLNLKSVYFEFDKYTLTPEAKAILADNAKQLMEHPNVRIRLEGNCDERGTNQYNLSLGEKRARSVKEFLVNYGISPDRIEIISYGEERPVCTEHNESCWWRNRRVDFVIISQ